MGVPGAKTRGFRPIRKTTVVENIIGQIKTLIQTEHYGAQSDLPNERDLARELGVSRHSVREALRTLAHMGVLDTRHGLGTQVAESSSNLLKAPLEFLIMFDRPSMMELFETRELLEVNLAGWAAERRTSEDLEEMETALREMRENVSDPQASTAADVRFHEAVAAAAHNRILQRLVSGLHDPMFAFIEAVRPGVQDLRKSVELHAGILGAIRRQDAGAARELTARTMVETRDEIRRAQLSS